MKKLWKENIENYPAILYQEEDPGEDFIDVDNDMEEWDRATNIMDWSRRRDKISPLFYSEAGYSLENFASLSVEKKLIGCIYFLIPYSIRIQLITDEEDKYNWEYLLTETKKSRLSCIEVMRLKTGQYIRIGLLSLAQTQTFYDDVYLYIFKFENANEGDFKKWIFGLDEFEGVFESKEYYNVDLQTDLINIYNGDY